MKNQIKKAFIKLNSSLVYGIPFLLIMLVLFLAFYFKTEEKTSFSKITNNSIVNNFKKIKTNFSDSIPKVYGANFDLAYKKIPEKTKYVEFNLGAEIDEKTVGEETFIVSPVKKGKIKVEKNKIKYIFDKPLEKGEKVSFFISKDIKAINSKKLDKDYNFLVTVVGKVKVLRISPEKKIEDLTKPILVFFNLPIVPLVDLDSRDNLPCLLEIEPKIEGKCRWLTTSILEFTPKDRFVEATNYKVRVMNKQGLLYALEDFREINLQTPKIEFFVGKYFDPKDGLIISSNFPVKQENLKNNLEFYIGEKILPGQKQINKKALKIDFRIEKVSASKYKIFQKKEDFSYGKTYSILVKAGVEPEKGNIKTEKDFFRVVKSKEFLKEVSVNMNVLSKTGAIIDTEKYLPSNSTPIKNIFLDLELQQEIVLDNSLFSFEDNSGKKINLKISYIKEVSGEKEIENKKKIRIKILDKLENNKEYNLILDKKINKNLEKNIVQKIYTSKKLEVNEIKIFNYKKICFYTNNKISGAWKKKNDFLDFFPKVKIGYVSEGKDYPSYKLQKQYNFKKIPDEVLTKKGYCREPKKDEKLYVIHPKMNPNTEYKISVSKKLRDVYGNNFEGKKELSFKTGEIQDRDKEFYFSTNNDVSVIPKDANIIFALQSTNLDKINLEVRELNVLDFLKNKYWERSKNYEKQTKKEVKLKNKYWNFTKNLFDLEKDFLGRKLTTNIVQIGAFSGEKNEFTTYIKTNISLVLEVAKNKKVLFITDFNGKKVENLVLKFYRIIYDKKGNIIEVKEEKIENQKKENGIIEFKKLDTKKLVIVAENKDLGYFGMLDSRLNSTSNYDFKYISGVSSSQKNYLYLYTERPIYKPGDTVYFKGILRKFGFKGYSKTDIKEAKLEILDPKRKVIKTIELKDFKNSNFSGEFVIPKGVSTGKFSFAFKTGKDTIRNNANFFIEEYRKPVFKVKVEEDKKDFVLGEKTTNTISGEYYFGGKLKNTSGEYSVLVQNYFFDSKDFSDYKFGEGYEYFNCLYWGSCDYDDDLVDSKNFKIAENGKTKLEYIFPNKIEDAEKIYSFGVVIKDPDTSRVVRKSFSKILHTTDGYVGLKTNYFYSKGEKINGEIVVLDHKAEVLKNKNVKVELIKTTWKDVKKKGVDGVFYHEYELEKKLEQELKVVSNEKGLANFEFSPKKSGEYLVKVSYIGKNKKEFVSSSDVFVESESFISWRNSNNSITKLEAEKIKVNVGDEAKFILKSPVNKGKAIIFIEKDDGILDYFVHDLKTYSDTIKIKVKTEYYPNFYTKVFLIGKKDKKLLPTYKRALASTKVDTKFKKLNIKIITNKNNYLPREKVKLKIEVKDNNGVGVANTNLSIGIVDQSLLALKGNPKKNPYAFFYDLKRYLGVQTFLSLSNLVDKLEVIDAKNGEKGGSGDKVKGGDSKKKRGVFKDTAFWLADTKTNEKGEAFIESENLPDNLTTWVIEAVGNTPDTKVGVAYETILTTKKLQINDNLPNFFGSNDEIILSPVIFNRTGKKAKFKVTLNGTNFNIKLGEAEKIIELDEDSSKRVNFKIKIKDIGISGNKNIFSSKVNIKVESEDKKFLDEIEKFVRIKETSIKENIATSGKTSTDSFKEIINLSNLKNRTGTLKINYSKTIFGNLTSGIDYLDSYPYGCSEQQTSAIMPNIYIKKLYDSAQIPFDFKTKMIKKWAGKYDGYTEISLQNVIENYLVNIRKFQNSDGGFVYFYDVNSRENYSNFDLSVYMLDSLSKIRDTGFKVDDTILQNLVKYLKTRFYANYDESCKYYYNYRDNCEYSVSSRLKAISAILSYDSNDYETYKMYKILKNPSKIPLSNFPPKGERIATKNKKREIKLDPKIFYNKLDEAIFLAKLVRNKNISNNSSPESSPFGQKERGYKSEKVKKEIPKKIKNKTEKEKKEENKGLNEKEELRKRAIALIQEVIDKKLSLSARGAFIEGNDRISDTTKFLRGVSLLGLENFKNIEKIIDLTNAWLIKQKRDDGSFGSTAQTIKVIEAISEYLISSKELKNVDDYVKILLNSKVISEKKFDDKNKLEVVKKILNIENLKKENEFLINKTGLGSVYYDLNLGYYLDTKDLKSRDEGFFVERVFYKYEEYKNIESLQKAEREEYKNKKISYEELKYPKSIINYLTPVKSGKVGELLIVYNKIIIPESRDKVLFEGFIPSGATLINPNLDTSEKKSVNLGKDNLPKKASKLKEKIKQINIGELYFDKKEFRLDRFFGYKEYLNPGIYDFTYLIRLTHSGNYNIKPTKVSEFYNVETFGRTAGEVFVVE